MATIDIFEKRSLTNAINRIKATEPFVISNIFKFKQIHSAEKVDIEIVSGNERLAQFASPQEAAIPVKKLTSVVKTVTVPRTYEKKIFTAYELANFRVAGDIYASAAEIEKNVDERILREIEELKDRALRRREQMACAALSTGKITVNQDNIKFEIDFEFENGKQLINLTGNNKWSDAASNPLKDLQNWKRKILQRSNLNADILLLGADASDAFLSNQVVKDALDKNNYRVGQLDLNVKGTAAAIYLGRFVGIDVYEYSQQYKAIDGTVNDLIPANKAILLSSQSDAFRLHIAPLYRIENGQLRLIQNEFLVEPSTNEDKTILEWRVEQKSLPAIHIPDAIISASVV